MQYGKLGDDIYTIEGILIALHIVEKYENRPDLHILKKITTNNSAFWNFVFDALIELKQNYLDIIENVDGDSSPEAISNAKIFVEQFREIEATLSPLVGESRRKPENLEASV